MGFLPALDSEEEVAWVTLEDSQPLPDIDWKILTFLPPPEEDNSQYRKKIHTIAEIVLCSTFFVSHSLIKMKENFDYLHIELMLMNTVVIHVVAGLDFEALLIKPKKVEDGVKLPLIVTPHGWLLCFLVFFYCSIHLVLLFCGLQLNLLIHYKLINLHEEMSNLCE